MNTLFVFAECLTTEAGLIEKIGVIVGIMSSFGIFSMVNALGGKNLRLSRSKRDNHEEVKPWK